MKHDTTPRKILEQLVMSIGLRNNRNINPEKPGSLINSLSEDIRQKLQQLKSSELQELTCCAQWAGYIGPFTIKNNSQTILDKLEFDKRLRLDLRRIKDKL